MRFSYTKADILKEATKLRLFLAMLLVVSFSFVGYSMASNTYAASDAPTNSSKRIYSSGVAQKIVVVDGVGGTNTYTLPAATWVSAPADYDAFSTCSGSNEYYCTNNRVTIGALTLSSGTGDVTLSRSSGSYYRYKERQDCGNSTSVGWYLVNVPITVTVPNGRKLVGRAHTSTYNQSPAYTLYATQLSCNSSGNCICGTTDLNSYPQGGETKNVYLGSHTGAHRLTTWTSSGANYVIGANTQTFTLTYAQTALTVNYNANGGSGTTPSSDTFNYSDTYSSGLADNNGLTKTGYHGNNKWHVGSATGTLLSATTSYTGKTLATATSKNIDSADASVTLYADYDPNDYTVTFNPNGGTFQGTTSTSTKTVTYDSSTNNSPGVPTRTGYTFNGWYTSGGTQVFDANGAAINGTYWNGSGTTTLHQENTTYYSIQFGYYNFSSDHKIYFKFDTSSSSSNYYSYDTVNNTWQSDILNTAWTYYTKGTTTVPSGVTNPNNYDHCYYLTIDGVIYRLYDYASDFSSSEHTYFEIVGTGATWQYTSNLTVHAHWTAKNYTVTFNPLGGTFQSTTGTSTKTVTYDSSTNSSPGVATWDNHTFQGWYTVSGTQVFDAGGNAVNGTYWQIGGSAPSTNTNDLPYLTPGNGARETETVYYGLGYYNSKYYYADRFWSAYYGERDKEDYGGYRLYEWSGSAWTSVYYSAGGGDTGGDGVEPPSSHAYYAAWNNAWGHRTLSDHGASYWSIAPAWKWDSDLTVYAIWAYVPSSFTITRSDYNTFTYSASGASSYYVSTSSSQPSASASGWTTSTSKDVSTSAKETWYVYAKDAQGNVTGTYVSTTNYKVTLSAGTGTTLTAKADSTSGASVTSGMYVLNNTPVYPTGSLSTGYNTLVVQKDGTTITNTSSNPITADSTFSTSATINRVRVALSKDNGSYISGTGYTVHISTQSSTDTETWTGTTVPVSGTGTAIAPVPGTMSPSNTYYVWIGKDENHKSTMAYSGVSFTGGTDVLVNVNYYTVTASLSNTTMTFNGTSISSGGTVVALGTGTGSKIHSIVATPNSGYTFSSWSSSTTSSAIASTSSTSTTMNVGAATTLTGTSTQNSATITIKKDGSAWSASGIKISLRTSSTATTDSYTQTVSSGSTATFSGLTTTYYIWAGKSDAAKTTMVYTGYTIGVGVSQTRDINYYTITRSQDTGTTLTTKWDSASGTAFTNNPVVLGNNVVTIYASSTINTGYQGTATLKHGTTTMTASGSTFTVSVNEAITSGGATPKILTITLNNQSATTAGTTAIYEKYATGFYLNSTATTQMTTSTNGITVPTRNGYTFDGYYTSESGGTKYIDSSGKLTSSASYTNFTSDGTLYAYWSKAVSSLSNTITTSYIYDGNSHCPTPIVKDGSTTLTNNTDYTYACTNNTNVGTANLTITGKNVYNSTTKAYYTGTTTINFNINNATLTFNANGGTGGGTVYTRYGSEVVYSGIRNSDETSIPSVSKTGYTLNGWYTAESGGSKVLNTNGSFASPIVSGYTIDSESGEIIWATTADRTLYAQYSVNIYTITLNNQDATTAGTASIYEKYGVGYYKEAACTNQMTTSSNGITVPTKTGYAFMGYYTETNGGGTKYIDASGKLTSSASNTHFTSNGTLYAYWSRTKLRITESVKGNQADTSKEFSFTINVKDNNEAAISGTYAYTGSKSGNLSFSGGNATFTLHHGQYIEVYFPTGYAYTITQNSDGYSLEKTNDSGTLNSDTTATFTDTLSKVTPTGFFLDIMPYIILLITSMGSIFLVNKFKNI